MVNGDDLLVREPRAKPGRVRLADSVFRHGGEVGLRSNWEKTLSDPLDAEINSTLFHAGAPEKKVNVASLYMKPEVVDVLGYALESTRTIEGFRRVVRANAGKLARQERKGYRYLPLTLQRVCKSDRKIRKALQSSPACRREQEATNFFPVCPRPEGYDLDREEEIQLIHERVDRVRRAAIAKARSPRQRAPKVDILRNCRSFRSVKYEKKPAEAEESILEVLASGWEAKQKRLLVEEEVWTPPTWVIGPSDGPGGRACAFTDAIRAFRNAERLRCDPITLAFSEMPFAEGTSVPSEGLAEYELVSG